MYIHVHVHVDGIEMCLVLSVDQQCDVPGAPASLQCPISGLPVLENVNLQRVGTDRVLGEIKMDILDVACH